MSEDAPKAVALQETELVIASFSYDVLGDVLWKTVVSKIFFESSDDRFFWIGFFADDRRVSVILKPDDVERFPSPGLLVDENLWTPLRLECDIHSASCALARSSIPIYCISSFSCDYVLVPVPQKAAALAVLPSSPSCASDRPCSDRFDRLHVSLQDTPLRMFGFSSQQLRAELCLPTLRSLLSADLLDARTERVFAFCEAEGRVSVLGDENTLESLGTMSVASRAFRSFLLCDSIPEANDQPGIVAYLTQPFRGEPSRPDGEGRAEAVGMISTFNTDYLLVPSLSFSSSCDKIQLFMEIVRED